MWSELSDNETFPNSKYKYILWRQDLRTMQIVYGTIKLPLEMAKEVCERNNLEDGLGEAHLYVWGWEEI